MIREFVNASYSDGSAFFQTMKDVYEKALGTANQHPPHNLPSHRQPSCILNPPPKRSIPSTQPPPPKPKPAAHRHLPRQNDDTLNTIELSHKEITDKIGLTQLEQELECGTIEKWLKPGTRPEMKIWVYGYKYNASAKTSGTTTMARKATEGDCDQKSIPHSA